MSTIINGSQLRAIDLGQGPVSKASGTLTDATTTSLFTVAGGEVLITALWMLCTTSMTGANTLAINLVPTAGNTMTLVTATDLGTTDTVAGSVIGLDQGTTAASKFLIGGRVDLNAAVTTGTVGLVQTGTGTINGAVTVYVTWIPLTDGATLVAA
jgi:hypothetical protein